MAIEIVADLDVIEPGSPEWLELRRIGIGGSDAGAVCGLSYWRTPYQVWAEKVTTAPAVAEEEPEYVQWGKLLEPVVRAEFSRRTGIEVHPLPKMVRNTEYPWMLASVDGVTGPTTKLTGAYEGKTTRRGDQWPITDDGAVQVPLPYMVQGMHYLAVLTSLERVYFGSLIGGQELRIAEVERDDELIADLIEIEEAFWRKVLEGEPPPVGPADVSTLRARWQPTAGKVLELPASFKGELVRRSELKVEIKALEEEVAGIDADVMALMGDAEEATIGGRTVATWKSSSRSSVDWDEIGRVTHRTPEAAKSAFSKTGTSRRFLPKEITDDNN